jgi:putative ATP-binding cassette transporter
MNLLSDTGQLLSFLDRSTRGLSRVRLRLGAVVVLAGMSGVANTALLALLNRSLSRRGPADPRLPLAFAALCLLLPLCRFLSGAVLVRLTGETLRDLRVRLSQSAVAVPLRRFEEQGAHRLMNVLTHDVAAVTQALYSFPNYCMHALIVASSLVYLGILSWPVMLGVALFLGLGLAAYRLPFLAPMRHFRDGRAALDVLMEHFRSVTEGAKELRLHAPRRRAFFRDELAAAASANRRSTVAASVLFAGTASWGQALFFVLIGIVLFVLPAFQGADYGVLVGYSLVILYMMAPLDYLMSSLPTLSQAAVSVQAIERMGLELGEPEPGVALPNTATRAAAVTAPWHTLELQGVTHLYARDGEPGTFVLGPIDLALRPGELLFLVGGNGSGKTTLAKLITGLYRPRSGTLRLDGEEVDEAHLAAYRQHFSAVFADFYLFDKLLGLDAPDLDLRAREELVRLRLDHKVTVDRGVLSTVDLSQGQRKRLALLTACLEDRSLYLFDEWAADQDPYFKEIFYRQILPALQAKGKTVIVITHDDRYFDLADRLVKLEYGQVVENRQVDRDAPAGVPSYLR